MESDPLFTVVVAAYNGEATISRALESVLDQSFSEWQVIVVDDGSTDGTRRIVDRLAEKDDRIIAISQANGGTAAARNAAIPHARGRFIAVLDADDELMPGYMATMAAFVTAHPGFDIYSCNGWVVWPDGRRRLYAEDPQHRPIVSMDMADLLDGQRFLCLLGSMTEASLLRDLGGFRAGVYCEDVDLWRRAFARGARHAFCPEPLVVYHRDVESQKTSDVRTILESLVEIDTSLLQSGLLAHHESEIVRVKIAEHKRRLLEEKVRLGETSGILRLMREARLAYRDKPKYYAALLLGMVDERLLARVATKGRRVDAPHDRGMHR